MAGSLRDNLPPQSIHNNYCRSRESHWPSHLRHNVMIPADAQLSRRIKYNIIMGGSVLCNHTTCIIVSEHRELICLWGTFYALLMFRLQYT